jgi:hypothetical protein
VRACWLEHCIEGPHKLGIPVVGQEMDGRFAFVQSPNRLASLLCHSGTIGMTGASRQTDAPRVQLDKKEDVHRLQAERLSREEIARQDLVFVVGHELVPADRSAALRCRADAIWKWRFFRRKRFECLVGRSIASNHDPMSNFPAFLPAWFITNPVN